MSDLGTTDPRRLGDLLKSAGDTELETLAKQGRGQIRDAALAEIEERRSGMPSLLGISSALAKPAPPPSPPPAPNGGLRAEDMVEPPSGSRPPPAVGQPAPRSAAVQPVPPPSSLYPVEAPPAARPSPLTEVRATPTSYRTQMTVGDRGLSASARIPAGATPPVPVPAPIQLRRQPDSVTRQVTPAAPRGTRTMSGPPPLYANPRPTMPGEVKASDVVAEPRIPGRAGIAEEGEASAARPTVLEPAADGFAYVDLPNGGRAKFNPGTTLEEASRQIIERFPEYGQSLVGAMMNSFAQGVGRGGAGVLQTLAAMQNWSQTEAYKLDQMAMTIAGMPAQQRAEARAEVDKIGDPVLRQVLQTRVSDVLEEGLGEQGYQRADLPTPIAESGLQAEAERIQRGSEGAYPVQQRNREGVRGYLADVAGAAGTTGPIIAAAMVNPVLGALVSSGMNVGESIDEAIRAGATDEQIRDVAIRGGLPAAALDYVAVDRLLRPWVRKAGLRGLALAILGKASQQGLVEGGTEGAQKFVQNLAAREAYEPGREITEGVVYEALIGMGLGVLFGAGAGAVSNVGPADVPPGGPVEQPDLAAPAPAAPGAPDPGPAAEPLADPVGQAGQAGPARPEPTFDVPPQQRPVPGQRAVPQGPLVARPDEGDPEASAAERQADQTAELQAILDDERSFDEIEQARRDEAIAGSGAPDTGSRVRITFADGGTEQGVVGEVRVGAGGDVEITVNDENGDELYAGPLGDVGLAAVDGAGTRQDPARPTSPADMADVGARVAQPTPAQADVGNYRKGHVSWQGMNIAIETPRGGSREGIDADGKPWRAISPADYGYVKRTEGADGDQVDVYMGREMQATKVWVVDQIDPATGKFDEHKAMLAFASQGEAVDAYNAAFSDGSGPRRLGAMTQMDLPQFKRWLKAGKRRQPLAWKPPAAPTETPATKRIQIGVTAAGLPLYEDGNGVRSFARDGVRVTEPVQVRPDGGVSVNPDRRQGIFLTAEEFQERVRQSEAPAAPEPAPQQDQPAPKPVTPQLPPAYDAEARRREQEAVGPRVFVNRVGRDGKTDAEREQEAIRQGQVPIEDDRERQRRENVAKLERQREAVPDSEAAARETLRELDDRQRATLSHMFGKHLLDRPIPSIQQARKMAGDALEVIVKPGTPAAKQVDEAVELGIVIAARAIVETGRFTSQTDRQLFDDLVALYDRQPNLNVRTSDSVARQAYSTPAPLAFLASRLAGIDAETTVYEPSAGNGMLLIQADLGKIIANEIDPARRQALDDLGIRDVSGQDAAELGGAAVRSRAGGPVDVVIANPPFGRLGGKSWTVDERLGFVTREIDQAIAAKALEAMKDDGRAVLIVGGVMGSDGRRAAYRGKAKSQFHLWLHKNYRVSAIYSVAGDLYKKQGAGFPVDVIVIEGKGKSDRPLPGVQVPPMLSSWDALGEILDGKRPDVSERPADDVGDGLAGSRGAAVQRDPDGTGGAAPDAGSPDRVPERESRAPDAPARGRGERGAPDDGDAGRPGPAAGAAPASGPVEPGTGGEPADRGQRDLPRPPGEQPDPVERPAGGTEGEPGPADDASAPDAGLVAPGPADDGAAAGADSLDDLIDTAIADQFGGETEAPAPSDAPSEAVEKRDTSRTAGQAAKSAATETAMGLDQVASGLTSLFGGKGGRLGSGPSFDEETYRQAKPYFRAGIAHFAKAGADVADMVRALVKALAESYGMARETIEAMKPYIKRFIQEVQSGAERVVGVNAKKPARGVEKVEDRETQKVYVPASRGNTVQTLVPTNQRDAVQAALDRIKSKVGDIDAFVAGKLGYEINDESKVGLWWAFSAEQVDALALAIDNIEAGAGMIVGDQTGVGKGRIVAGLMVYAKRHGITPIFATIKPTLYADIIRDLVDIGAAEMKGGKLRGFNPLVTNAGLAGEDAIQLPDNETLLTTPPLGRHRSTLGKVIQAGDLGEFDAVFTTYDQTNSKKGQKNIRHHLLDALAPGALLLLDESHAAGGTGAPPQEGTLPRSEYWRTLVGEARAAYYSSATWAKRPDVVSLYRATNLRLAISDAASIDAVFKRGGIPMQQIVSTMLTQDGQYLRRERSFEGIEFNATDVKVDQAMAEEFSEALAQILEVDQKLLEIIEKIGDALAESAANVASDGSRGGAGAMSVNFTSIMHNLIEQYLLAAKAEATVDHALERLKAGERVVIAVKNTMGSFIADMADTAGVKPGDPLDLSVNDLLLRYLERTLHYTIREPFSKVSERGQIDLDAIYHSHRDVYDAYMAAKEMIEGLDFGGMPVSPIDYLHWRLRAEGYKTGELTGRDHTIDYSAKTPVYRRRGAKEKGKRGVGRTIDDFNNGDTEVVILNQSGSTGLSLHSSEKFRNQNKRHMLIVQAEGNIDTFMQILGRINRTGQLLLPAYSLLNADIPAQIRIAAMLMKKMASLNANTTSSRSSDVTTGDVLDFVNEVGDRVVAELVAEMEINERLGSPLKDNKEGDGFEPEEAARKVSGRITLLPIGLQREFYQRLDEAFRAELETLDALGENPLEAKTLDLEAVPVSRVVLVQGKESGSVFAQPSHLEVLNVKRLRKPLPRAEVETAVREFLGLPEGTTPYQTQQAGYARAKRDADTAMDEARAHIEAEVAKVRDSVAEDASEKAATAAGARADSTRKRLQLRLDRLDDLLRNYPVGSTVVLKSQSGNTHAVVTGWRRRGKSKNPLALGGYEMQLAWLGPQRAAALPFSKIVGTTVASKNEPESSVIVQRTDGDYLGKPLLEWFDSFQAETREDRAFITGNIPAGYATLDAKGTIVNFTDADGRIRQGVMLPQEFKAKDEVADLPVVFDTVESVIAFMDGGRDRAVFDKTKTAVLTREGSNIRISVPKAKAKGGRFFLNPTLLSALGTDFVSVGNDMRAEVRDRNKLLTVLRAMVDQFGDLVALEHKQAAYEVQGKKPPEMEQIETPAKFMALGNAPSDRFVDDTVAFRLAMIQELTRLGLADKVDLDLVFELFMPSGAPAAGRTDFAPWRRPDQKTLITIALKGGDRRVLRHEVIHALRKMGLLTAAEWEVLERKAAREWRKRYDVERNWEGAGLDEDALNEEAVAEAFADHDAERDAGFSGAVRRIFEKIRSFFEAIGNALRGRGFRSAEAIFRGIESGEIGSREFTMADHGPAGGEIVGALVEAGFSTQEALGMTWPQAATHLRADSRSYAPSRRRGTPEQESIGKRLMDSHVERTFSGRLRMTSDAVLRFLHPDNLIQGMVDSFYALKRYETASRGAVGDGMVSPWKAALRSQNLRGVMTVVLRAGPVRYDATDGTFKLVERYGGFTGGFEAIFEPLAKSGELTLWQWWAIARRARNLEAQGREKLVGRIAGELGMTVDAALDHLDRIATASPERQQRFEQVHQHYQAFNKAMLDLAQQTGLTNDVQRRVWEQFGDYVPFYRILDEDVTAPGQAKRGIADQRGPFRKLKGGEAVLDDLLSNMISNLTYIVDASYKNQAMQRAVEMLGPAGAIEKVPNLQAAGAVVPLKEARDALTAAGVNVDAMSPAQRRAIVSMMQLVPPRGRGIVSVMKEGKADYYRVGDPLLLRSLLSLNFVPFSAPVELLAGAKRMFTQLVTIDPTFMAANMIRDTLATKVLTGENLKGGAATFKGAIDAARWDSDLYQLMAAGASATDFYETGGSAVIARMKRAQIRSSPRVGAVRRAVTFTVGTARESWALVEHVGFAGENANRLAVYRSLRRKGKSIAEAAHEAQDIMNFSMRGDFRLIQGLAATVPFFNARLQGLYRLGRGFTSGAPGEVVTLELPGGRQLTVNKGVLLRGSILAALSLLYYLWNHDDERFQDLPDWERDVYWHFWIEGVHVRIPKPFEIGSLFATMPERIAGAFLEEDGGSTLGSSVVRMILDTFALNPFANPIIWTTVEQVANRNFFIDSPIEGIDDQGRMPEARFSGRTSITAREVGQALGVSPERIEHGVYGLTGAVGRYVLALADLVTRELVDAPPRPSRRLDEIPFVQRFVREEPAFTSRWVNELYAAREEVNQVYKTIRYYRDIGEIERAQEIAGDFQMPLAYRKQLNDAARALAGVRKEIDAIERSRSMTGEQKRVEIDKLLEARLRVAKQAKPAILAIRRAEQNPSTGEER